MCHALPRHRKLSFHRPGNPVGQRTFRAANLPCYPTDVVGDPMEDNTLLSAHQRTKREIFCAVNVCELQISLALTGSVLSYCRKAKGGDTVLTVH
jgi:hypothetical protein